MIGFVLNMTGLVLNMTGFVLNITGFFLNMTGFVLNMSGFVLNMSGFVLNMTGFFFSSFLVFLGLLQEMAGYGWKVDYHNPRSIQTKQDQPKSNQGQLNKKKTEFGTDCLGLVNFRNS